MSVLEKSLTRLIAALSENGYQFGIITPEGEKIGDLDVVPPRRKRGPIRNPGVTNHVRECIRSMNIGEIRVIDSGPFDPNSLRSVISYAALQEFGDDAEVATVSLDDGNTEIMRL